MHIARRGVAQQLLQINLLRRRIQQIETANDMVNLLQIIVNHHGKLIGDDPVFALDDKIAVLLGKVMTNQALQLVLKGNAALINLDAQRIGTIGQVVPVFANAGVNIGMSLMAIVGGQCFSAASARVDQFFAMQIANNSVINIDISALIINIAVPMQAESVQGL